MSEGKRPKMRFKGFREEWEEQKLEEVADRIVRKNKDLESRLPLTISAQHGLVDQFAYFNNRVASRDVSNYYLLKKGDFAYNKSYSTDYPFGAVKRLDLYEMGVLSTLYIVFLPKKEIVNSDFLVSYYNTTNWHRQIIERASEGARNHGLLNISADDFLNTKLRFAKSIGEQTKIGNFFKNLDNLIALNQRKHDKLINVKKSCLEKMFPKNGDGTPEIRFKGFSGGWERRKIGEVCSISTGKSNTQDKVEDGKYPFYVRSPIIERSNRYLFDEQAVLTVGDGVGTGKVFHYVNGKYDLHQRVYRMFNFDIALSAKFFYYYFSLNFYKRVMAMTAKTSVDSVRFEMISEMDIVFPTEKEQVQITALLETLDTLIALRKQELEKLKNIKKACLDKMFI